ncbi:hypothetical protein F4775DRAFT_123065 [Biscogniauxia sp. FL1348]|nr:hypothetical protein F4775DRAFT_123065 [Biscogniauxia sp. FL1348]
MYYNWSIAAATASNSIYMERSIIRQTTEFPRLPACPPLYPDLVGSPSLPFSFLLHLVFSRSSDHIRPARRVERFSQFLIILLLHPSLPSFIIHQPLHSLPASLDQLVYYYLFLYGRLPSRCFIYLFLYFLPGRCIPHVVLYCAVLCYGKKEFTEMGRKT